jgi:hypothetical protein
MKKILLVVISVAIGVVIGLFGSKVVGDYERQEMRNDETAWIESIEESQDCSFIGTMREGSYGYVKYVFLTHDEYSVLPGGVAIVDKFGHQYWYGSKTDEYDAVVKTMCYVTHE